MLFSTSRNRPVSSDTWPTIPGASVWSPRRMPRKPAHLQGSWYLEDVLGPAWVPQDGLTIWINNSRTKKVALGHLQAQSIASRAISGNNVRRQECAPCLKRYVPRRKTWCHKRSTGFSTKPARGWKNLQGGVVAAWLCHLKCNFFIQDTCCLPRNLETRIPASLLAIMVPVYLFQGLCFCGMCGRKISSEKLLGITSYLISGSEGPYSTFTSQLGLSCGAGSGWQMLIYVLLTGTST